MGFLRRHSIIFNWFSINPLLFGYPENIWQERLAFLASQKQNIEQHSHFYVAGKGTGYNLDRQNIEKHLLADKIWLENQGFKPIAFVPGAWKKNQLLGEILKQQGFQYDLTGGRFKKASIKNILFIKKPSETNPVALHFHDYDLKNSFKYLILLLGLAILKMRGFQFINLKELC